MSERHGRLIENLLALLGGLVLAVAALAHPFRDMGLALGACPAVADHTLPWEQLIVGVVLVMPKTISRGTASDFVGAVGKRLGGATDAALKALRKPPEDG